MTKYLHYAYTLSLSIIPGHNQTICADLNRPSAGAGKGQERKVFFSQSYTIFFTQPLTAMYFTITKFQLHLIENCLSLCAFGNSSQHWANDLNS